MIVLAPIFKIKFDKIIHVVKWLRSKIKEGWHMTLNPESFYLFLQKNQLTAFRNGMLCFGQVHKNSQYQSLVENEIHIWQFLADLDKCSLEGFNWKNPPHKVYEVTPDHKKEELCSFYCSSSVGCTHWRLSNQLKCILFHQHFQVYILQDSFIWWQTPSMIYWYMINSVLKQSSNIECMNHQVK